MITDGDLRRAMVNSTDDELFTRTATEIMTKNPKVTSADVLVAEVVNFMNSKSITQLFVVEEQKPIGVIHLHDCLRAGFTVGEKDEASANANTNVYNLRKVA